MKIKRLTGGNLESNGYIVIDKSGTDCYIIDPGYNGERYLKEVSLGKLSVLGILLTHHHYDHVGGVQKIKAGLDCRVYMHRNDADVYKGEVDVFLEGGEEIKLGDELLHVFHTPGHTAGGVCFFSPSSKAAFTGDTIFNVDIGRTDLADGSYDEISDSIRNIVSKWDNDVVIYPGHGDPANMKFVRIYNGDYLEIMGEMKNYRRWSGEKFIL